MVYYNEASKVYTIRHTLTPTQHVVAAYWVDANNTNTPLGHMISITAILLRDHHAMLALASEAYARVSIAEADV